MKIFIDLEVANNLEGVIASKIKRYSKPGHYRIYWEENDLILEMFNMDSEDLEIS